ncbi:hypothetical protein Angca_007387, partial [Angiostrongylus cantonensis]
VRVLHRMNIYTPAEGLFGTHVTWEDIEADMQREFHTTASFGPNKSAKNISDCNGFMSIIALIDPDWQRKDKELPEKFVVKILTQLVMLQFTNEISKEKKIGNKFNDPELMATVEYHMKRCHNTEVTVYNHLLNLPEGKVPLPKVFFMRRFTENNLTKGYIIMEYMENLKMVHIYENLPTKSMKQILRAKAVLEAMSLDFTPGERSEFSEKPFTELFGAFFKVEFLDDLMEIFHSFEQGSLSEKTDRLGKVLPYLVDLEWANRLPDEMGMQRVLCHGDLWSMNVLWRTDDDDLKMAALIDYQVAHFGCPAVDLVRLMSACLSGKDRREHWEELLEEFYGYLKEECGNREMPYTLEQLKESYRRFFPLGAFMIIPIIGPLFDIICKKQDEHQKQKSLEVVMKKTEHLLDDMLHYHERNMELRRG